MMPYHITLQDDLSSLSLEKCVEKKISKLDQYCPVLGSCRVIIKAEQKHKHRGKLFNVRIDLTVPGRELAITKKQNEDVYVAIRDAFLAAARLLAHYTEKRTGRWKQHANRNKRAIVYNPDMMDLLH